MEKYWNERYAKEGKIWGDKPSATAIYAKDLFLEKDLKKVLIPGFGYGRNARVFQNEGLDVTGVEISEEAIKMAQKDGLKIKIVKASLLDFGAGETFDAVYCYNLLHYFLKDDRKKIVQKCLDLTKQSGYIFMAALSEKDPDFKQGKEVEENTFEKGTNQTAHFFKEDDFLPLFKDFSLNIVDTGCMNDAEEQGEAHKHIVRYLFAQKTA